MANYSHIGYAPDSIVFGGGSTVSLSGTYDPDDRRVFNVVDDDVGTVLNGGAGRPDEGTIFDGDRYNNEVGDDATQTGDATNLDGTTTYESGNIYLEQSYTLTAAGEDDIILYRVEIDGTLVGYITSEPLTAGITYSWTSSNVIPTNAPDTTGPELVDVPCFCAGTFIRTPTGDRLIETLVAGDHILTSSGDVKTIRWIGQRTVRKDLAAEHDL